MFETFVRDRITQLRLKKGVSEYQMSYDLGHSRGYINNISSGKALPSMSEFFAICENFSISPEEFFNERLQDPVMYKQILSSLEHLTTDDLLLVFKLIQRLLH